MDCHVDADVRIGFCESYVVPYVILCDKLCFCFPNFSFRMMKLVF
uniref:Uncharacterized protein n=1 Tax=Arundo donax TaxID=35708 RepID=A0A0A9E7D7_ARUDO